MIEWIELYLKLSSSFSFIKHMLRAITISLCDGLTMYKKVIGVTKENERKGVIMEQRLCILIKLT